MLKRTSLALGALLLLSCKEVTRDASALTDQPHETPVLSSSNVHSFNREETACASGTVVQYKNLGDRYRNVMICRWDSLASGAKRTIYPDNVKPGATLSFGCRSPQFTKHVVHWSMDHQGNDSYHPMDIRSAADNLVARVHKNTRYLENESLVGAIAAVVRQKSGKVSTLNISPEDVAPFPPGSVLLQATFIAWSYGGTNC